MNDLENEPKEKTEYEENSAGDRISNWMPNRYFTFCVFQPSESQEQLQEIVNDINQSLIALLNNPNQPLSDLQWNVIDATLNEIIYIPEKFLQIEAQAGDRLLERSAQGLISVSTFLNLLK